MTFKIIGNSHPNYTFKKPLDLKWSQEKVSKPCLAYVPSSFQYSDMGKDGCPQKETSTGNAAYTTVLKIL